MCARLNYLGRQISPDIAVNGTLRTNTDQSIDRSELLFVSRLSFSPPRASRSDRCATFFLTFCFAFLGRKANNEQMCYYFSPLFRYYTFRFSHSANVK